jgi:hypothetical protein
MRTEPRSRRGAGVLLAIAVAGALALPAGAAAQRAAFAGVAWGGDAAETEAALLALGYVRVGRSSRGEPFLESPRGEFVQTRLERGGLVSILRSWEGADAAGRYRVVADSLRAAFGRGADTIQGAHLVWVAADGTVSLRSGRLPDGEVRTVVVHSAPASPAGGARTGRRPRPGYQSVGR